ncbi:MAG: hypothetical protein M1820_004187 [Bogoriella megaspora]|nr:MAG: hypothetical protein M1820_004187 [Bogoriella megaspora]
MVLEVYLHPCTVNSRKVLADLDLLGTQYHYNHIDYFAGEHRGLEYLKVNPHATLPSAVDDGPTITESNAILMYAAERDSCNSVYPKDPQKCAQVNLEYVFKPLLNSQPDESVIEGQSLQWHKLVTLLNDQLAKTKWLCGKEPTLTDIAVAASMHLHEAQYLPLDQHPQFKEMDD